MPTCAASRLRTGVAISVAGDETCRCADRRWDCACSGECRHNTSAAAAHTAPSGSSAGTRRPTSRPAAAHSSRSGSSGSRPAAARLGRQSRHPFRRRRSRRPLLRGRHRPRRRRYRRARRRTIAPPTASCAAASWTGAQSASAISPVSASLGIISILPAVLMNRANLSGFRRIGQASSRDTALMHGTSGHFRRYWPALNIRVGLMSDSYIIEVGSTPAGIVVRDAGGYRFFAASHRFNRLEGQLFGSAREAERAARRLLEGNSGTGFVGRTRAGRHLLVERCFNQDSRDRLCGRSLALTGVANRRTMSDIHPLRVPPWPACRTARPKSSTSPAPSAGWWWRILPSVSRFRRRPSARTSTISATSAR